MKVDTRAYQASDRDAVIGLWRSCGLVVPANHPGMDIDRKTAADPQGLRVVEIGGRIVATVMIGYEGHRGWINYLAVAQGHRRQGLGRKLMAEAEKILRKRGCPKINLQVREGNAEALAFYRAIGFSNDACVGLGKRLLTDLPPEGA